VAGYELNHPPIFDKIILTTNESEKLERTLKTVAFVECGEGDLEIAPLDGYYFEDFFKLVRDKLLFLLYIGLYKVAGLLPLGV
jgi:hypothetical protein